LIDYEQIGKRINEQRKYLHGISQEKMAEDLGLYQADISNLEKAKKGSGITDLSKLDMIADYFDIPLQILLFGSEYEIRPVYTRSKMRLRKSKRRIRSSHQKYLEQLLGAPIVTTAPEVFDCGPYTLYCAIEFQILTGTDSSNGANGLQTICQIQHLHIYVFLGNEVLGVTTAAVATMFQHINLRALKFLQDIIPSDILDVTDVRRILDPYWALYCFTDDEKDKHFLMEKSASRMELLLKAGADRKIVYIESMYIREDSRRHGLARMCIDFIEQKYPGCILWLNMEPTSGLELVAPLPVQPIYTTSELGQLNLNASIAEHLGFFVDPDTWHRWVSSVGSNGKEIKSLQLVRKCAYRIPPEIHNIIKNDGDLVQTGRMAQHLTQGNMKLTSVPSIFFSSGTENTWNIREMKYSYGHGATGKPDVYICAAYNQDDPSKIKLGISDRSIIEGGLFSSQFLESYSSLSEASDSPYYHLIHITYDMMIAHYQVNNSNKYRK
jgi:transcriptional regulator with XRE-family HTH domain